MSQIIRERELFSILYELTGSTPSGNFAVKMAFERLTCLITKSQVEAKLDERNTAQQFLHGLTIAPENRHLFDVLSRNNSDRIAELKDQLKEGK